MKNTVVAGGGVLGSQIAFSSAYCGCAVTIWLRSEGSIGRTQPKLAHLRKNRRHGGRLRRGGLGVRHRGRGAI